METTFTEKFVAAMIAFNLVLYVADSLSVGTVMITIVASIIAAYIID